MQTKKFLKRHERNWSSSKIKAYFTLNILTKYLQVVYKTTFGLR